MSNLMNMGESSCSLTEEVLFEYMSNLMNMGESSCSLTEEVLFVYMTAATKTHGWHEMAEHFLFERIRLSSFSFFFVNSRRHIATEILQNCRAKSLPLGLRRIF